jgi:hypothetical protein
MNENLIPQVIIDLVTKFLAAQDSTTESHSLELRLNDIEQYIDSAFKQKIEQKKARQRK